MCTRWANRLLVALVGVSLFSLLAFPPPLLLSPSPLTGGGRRELAPAGEQWLRKLAPRSWRLEAGALAVTERLRAGLQAMRSRNAASVRPTASVIVPIHNHAHFVDESLAPLVEEAARGWIELIIVDDASTDDLPYYLQGLVGRPNVRILSGRLGSLPRALNAGLTVAQGSCLSWTSADNISYLGLYRLLCESLSRSEHGLVYTSFRAIDDTGGPFTSPLWWARERVAVADWRVQYPPDTDRMLTEFVNLIGPAFAYRASAAALAGVYDPKLQGVEDFEYWLRLIGLAGAERADHEDRFPYEYRVHAHTLTATLSHAYMDSLLDRVRTWQTWRHPLLQTRCADGDGASSCHRCIVRDAAALRATIRLREDECLTRVVIVDEATRNEDLEEMFKVLWDFRPPSGSDVVDVVALDRADPIAVELLRMATGRVTRLASPALDLNEWICRLCNARQAMRRAGQSADADVPPAAPFVGASLTMHWRVCGTEPLHRSWAHAMLLRRSQQTGDDHGLIHVPATASHVPPREQRLMLRERRRVTVPELVVDLPILVGGYGQGCNDSRQADLRLAVVIGVETARACSPSVRDADAVFVPAPETVLALLASECVPIDRIVRLELPSQVDLADALRHLASWLLQGGAPAAFSQWLHSHPLHAPEA